MKEHARNVLVGLTVIVALVMLAGMILLFTGLPAAFQSGRVLRMNFPATAEVHTGDPIHLAGMRVGKVIDIHFADSDPRKGVQIVGRITHDVKLPGNVRPRIYTRGFVGGAYLELVPSGPNRVDPATGQKLEFLPADWSEPLQGTLKGSGLIPDELLDAVRGLSDLADNLNELIAPAPATTRTTTRAAESQPAPAGATLQESLAKMGRALDALEAVLGDSQNQANIKQTFANLAIATEKAADAMDALKGFATEAGKTAGEVNKSMVGARKTIADAGEAAKKFGKLADNADRSMQVLAAKLIDDAEKISAAFATINRVATKIESGEGTAGKLVNDPKLYMSLLAASEKLTKLMEEFSRLIEHVRKNGLPLKVK